jgi:hypothetical protein
MNEPREVNGSPITLDEMIARSIQGMSDREIAEETLFWLRQAGQALSQIQKGGIGAMMSGVMGNMFSKGK